MLSDSDRRRIRSFVQKGLGCGCPDEVFEDTDAIRDRAGAALQLAIGGRLLIRVHLLGRAEEVLTGLTQWFADGMRERQALGMKRLRLVLAAGNPEAIEAPARGLFDRMVAADTDVYLHVHGAGSLRAALGEDLLPQEAREEGRLSR
jgi:hypothetical protein